MRWRIFVVVLLFFVWSEVNALEVVIPEKTYEVARGDNVTIPCTFKSVVAKPKLIIITWSFEGLNAEDEKKVIATYFHPDGTTDIIPEYEKRTSVDLDITAGKANLNIKSVTRDENKNFECRLQIPTDDEGTPADTARLLVLVAPSPPICKIEGKAEYGQDLSLSCRSEEGSPPPTYKWDSYSVGNQIRPLDPKATQKDGILSLFNVSKDTSGFYICTSANKIRSAKCNMTLAVMPPSMNFASTGGIIGGVAAFVVVLIIIIIICCCCKKKKNEEDGYEMGKQADDEYAYPPGEGEENNREERRDRPDDRQSEYDDRRSDYDDRRSDYDDRRRDYDDRRSDYNDRRSDYNDRRSDYDDRRSDYDDRRSDYDDRRGDYDDRRERYNDRNQNDRRDRR